ncbi:MAG: hypothetical protein NC928_04725 [Candidatus Omnitrophica bacterium]|nr:hypothetical protein [Candidatus Omnitrophota bacterium]
MPFKKKSEKKQIKKKSTKRKVSQKRLSKKKIIKKRPTLKKLVATAAEKKKIIGIVTHYFPKVRAAVVKLKSPLSIGESIKIKGHTTDFTQTVTSMQINHVPILQAKKGQEIGLLVDSRVREHDIIYKE